MKKLQIISAMLLALGINVSASAANGFYAGVSVGQLDLEFCDGLGASTCDDEDTGWKLLGGFQLNENFAIEGGWADLGEYNASVAGNGITAEVDGIFLDVKASLPLTDEFSIFGKLGVLFWDTEYSGSLATSLGISDDDGTDAIYGLGAQFMFNEQFGVVGEWERFDSDDEVDMLSIGAIVKF